jgi:DNA mismatch repair protein MutS
MAKAKNTNSAQRRQYLTIKAQCPDVLLLFRMGDFYEAFDEDAQTIHEVLGITLLQRDGHPVCGLPYFSAEKHIQTLLQAGHKVAIAEQMERPNAA